MDATLDANRETSTMEQNDILVLMLPTTHQYEQEIRITKKLAC
jgi:hypothetical protein